MSLKTVTLCFSGALLGLLLLGPVGRLFQTTPAFAQSSPDDTVYIEPGVRMLRT